MSTNRIWEGRFNEALTLRDQGATQRALEALLQLNDEFPNQPAILGMTGSLYWALQEFSLAREFYLLTTQLSPRSELASLGLFHSLWQIGAQEDALREMERLERLRPSEEYRLLRQELGLPEPPEPVQVENPVR